MALARVNRRQFAERHVEREQLGGFGFGDLGGGAERDAQLIAAAFGVAARDSVINQDLSHQPRQGAARCFTSEPNETKP